MQRQKVSLIFEGTVLNLINKSVPGIGIYLIFDFESHSHDLSDFSER